MDTYGSVSLGYRCQKASRRGGSLIVQEQHFFIFLGGRVPLVWWDLKGSQQEDRGDILGGPSPNRKTHACSPFAATEALPL